MKNTSAFYKLVTSVINVFLTFIPTVPALLYYGIGTEWKLVWIAIFFVYNFLCEVVFGRCVGMMILGTSYKVRGVFLDKILYVSLYTASFSTLLFNVCFPFDILLVNLLLVQLPCVLFTGTTLHGLLSGGVRTVWK